MQKTFEAITSKPLQQKFHSDIHNLTKCMMWFFDHCLHTTCSDTVNTSFFYVMYVKIVVAVSEQEKEEHASCEVLNLRAGIFEQARELLTHDHDESYHDFTSHQRTCVKSLRPKYENITTTKTSCQTYISEHDCRFYSLCVKAHVQCGVEGQDVGSYGSRACQEFAALKTNLDMEGQIWFQKVSKCVMWAVWNSVQKHNCEKLQSNLVSAYGTCFAENNMCLTLFQNSTYIESLFSVFRQSGPLGTAVLSQTNFLDRKCTLAVLQRKH
jgi:hypothetical protein